MFGGEYPQLVFATTIEVSFHRRRKRSILVANHNFETLDKLEEVLVHHCLMLLKQPDFIRGLTYFQLSCML